MNNGITHRFTTHHDAPVWIARIGEIIESLEEGSIEAYKAGHSLERSHQLACADVLASAMLGHTTTINRDHDGAPHLPEVIERVTISHTGDFMAMLISASPILALDIEIMDRDVERIIPRYTEDNELEHFRKLGIQNPALFIWSVKECLFKAVPVNKVLFREHLKIKHVLSGTWITSHCEIDHPELRASISVLSRIFEPLIVSYIDQSTYGHETI